MTDTTPTSERSSKPVVTLFESYGSGASYIGPRVAQALNVPFHAQAFSSEEIENAMVERESEGPLSQVFGAMGGQYLGIEGRSFAVVQQDKHDLAVENIRKVVEDARQGGVIIGRNGALILADWPVALHVKLDGPVRQRIERAAKNSGIDIERAAKRQKREDQVRADMSIEFYGWDPRETERYDLMVNTGTMDLDTCVDIIVQAALVKAGLASAASP